MSQASVALAALLLSWLNVLCDAAVITPRPAVENTNIRSVNVLKEHLRRNNDDYKASLDSPAPAPVYSTAAALRYRRAFDEFIDNYFSRANDTDATTETKTNITTTSNTTTTTTTTRPKTKKSSKVTQKTVPISAKPKSGPTRYPKYVNKEKADKAAKVREKHTETEAPRPTGPSSGARAAVPRPAGPVVGARPAVPPLERPVMRAGLAIAETQDESAGTAGVKSDGKGGAPGDAKGGAVRADDDSYSEPVVSSSQDQARVPSPYELDMAPAIGGFVHELRNKNRLCQRNVMIPEGPKYDSKGGVYLREFEPINGNDYPNTRKPRRLFPRCCNCCRKSVLGCE